MKPYLYERKTTIVGAICIAFGAIAGLWFGDWINASALIVTGAGFIVAKDAK